MPANRTLTESPWIPGDSTNLKGDVRFKSFADGMLLIDQVRKAFGTSGEVLLSSSQVQVLHQLLLEQKKP